MEINKEDIYTEYHDRVFRYILSRINDYQLSEDLCSDVFVKVYEKLDSFDSSKASFSTWIFTITRNRLIDYYRSRRVTSELPNDLVYEQDDDEVYDEDDLKALSKALEKLDDRSKKIVVGYYYENKKLKDIAEDLGISYAYVKILHKKALLILRKYLND